MASEGGVFLRFSLLPSRHVDEAEPIHELLLPIHGSYSADSLVDSSDSRG